MEPTTKRVKHDPSGGKADTPWVEKYRPKSLNEIHSQTETMNALRSCLKDGSHMPHFLFHGPPGTGKTTAILVVAHELFGPDFVKSRVKELNASDDRGISVVREKIKVFAQGAVGSAGQNAPQSDGKTYPVPPFKLIILDEADALLPDAQGALRRMMEDFSDVTRFCILCNYVSRIIDPIASRCAKFRFRPLGRESLIGRIQFICDAEKVKMSEESMKALEAVSGGDLRAAIMNIQSAQSARGNNLTKEDFVSVTGSLPAALMDDYIQTLFSHDFSRVVEKTRQIVREGFAASQVVAQLQTYLLSKECQLNTVQRAKLLLQLCRTEKRIADGGSDYLQLLDLGGEICSV